MSDISQCLSYEDRSGRRLSKVWPWCSVVGSSLVVPPCLPSGCSALRNPFSCCSDAPLCNTTGGCAAGLYWCHLQEVCLPVTSPCSPYDRSPAAGARFSYSLPPRYPATPPFYHLVADLPLRVEAAREVTRVRVRGRCEVQCGAAVWFGIAPVGGAGTLPQ